MSEVKKTNDSKAVADTATSAGSTATNSTLMQQSLAQLMGRLDDIVNWFNGADIDIEEATVKFDEGAELVAAIKTKLADTENKVNQIKLKLEKIEND